MKKFLCYDTNDAASGKINVSVNGVLKPNSTVPSTNGAVNQQLVTDGEGGAKWEDRLAYSESRICVSTPEYDNKIWCKVSDSLLTGSYDVGTPIRMIDSDGEDDIYEIEVSNDEVVTENAGVPWLILALHDNATFTSGEGWSILLPEKGTYFYNNLNSEFFVVGASLGNASKPEITWDGSVSIDKKIEQKYILKQSLYLDLVPDGYENDEEMYAIGNTRMTFDEVKECIKNDINIILVYNTGAELAFYYLTECTDERVTFTYNGSTKDDDPTTTFTITKNKYKGPIRNTVKYVQYNWDTEFVNKFLVVNPDGTVWPSSNLILPSSTSGSSKKFKIIVDDSGTITATEI